MHAGQQTTGVNPIMFYAASIFTDAGISDPNLVAIFLGQYSTYISTDYLENSRRDD